MNAAATFSGHQLRSTIDFLRRRLPGLQAIYLFGSIATGTSHADSDVDLAVLGSVTYDSTRLFELAAELAEMLHRDVDLLDLSEASTVMRAQIISSGQRIEGEGTALDDFESRTLSQYARLNEERAGILEDIARRGSIHGR